MNILVLGATGTIGTLLTQRLHDDGHAVTVHMVTSPHSSFRWTWWKGQN